MNQEKRLISISTGTMLRVVLIVLGIWFIYLIRDLVGILLVSILLAAVIDPLADFFEKKKIPRSVTVLVTYVLIFLLLAVLILAIIPPMIMDLHAIGDGFRSLWAKGVSSFDSLRQLSVRYGLEAGFQNSIDSLNDSLTGAFTNLFATVSNLLGGLVSFFVVLAISYFLIVEKYALRDIVVSLVPKRHHDLISGLAVKMQNKIGQWLIGQALLMLFIGVLSYVGFLALGVKFALLLAILAGLLEIVPYLGPTVAAVPAVFFALSDSPTKGLLVLIYCLLIQRVEHMVLVPKIMQKTTGLNPIFALLALAIGFTIGGIAGGLIAIPVATAANVVLNEYLERQNSSL